MPEEPAVRRARARVGQVLRGKWRLDALLGIGGMASVYAATHRNGKRGAVKLLHADLCRDEEARARFLREGYVANRVEHPGAVSVLDDDVADDGSVFLVMELLDGESVDSRADSQPGARLGVDETLDIGERLLDVLASAHDQGIVHRDIKPENLFLTRQGQLKVLDFGIARLREMGGSAQATRDGSLMGTPAFMPPEQALGEWSSVDGRTDLWAVGATLFCMLSGRPVHIGETVNKVLLSAMSHRAPALCTVLADVPPAVAEVIDRALMREPDKRWPDARAMQAALRQARAVTVRMHPPPPPQPPQAGAEATMISAVTPPPMSVPAAVASPRQAPPENVGVGATVISGVSDICTPVFHASPSLLGTAVTASERRRSATARLVAMGGAALTVAAVVGGAVLFFRRASETGAPTPSATAEVAAASEAVSAFPASSADATPADTAAAVPPPRPTSAPAASVVSSAAPAASSSAAAAQTAAAAVNTGAPTTRGGPRKPRRDYGF